MLKHKPYRSKPLPYKPKLPSLKHKHRLSKLPLSKAQVKPPLKTVAVSVLCWALPPLVLPLVISQVKLPAQAKHRQPLLHKLPKRQPPPSSRSKTPSNKLPTKTANHWHRRQQIIRLARLAKALGQLAVARVLHRETHQGRATP